MLSKLAKDYPNQTCLKIQNVPYRDHTLDPPGLFQISDMPNGDTSNLLYLNEPSRYYYKMCYFPMVLCCTLMFG